jgi:hypothetical protein
MGASGNLKAVGGEGIDPASKARQEHLYGQAERYAAQNPFSQRYGGQAPGMSAMAQAGQQFMANRLLGPGAYQAQNLGFQNYQPQFTYSPMGGGGGQPPFTPPGQPPAIDPMATAAPTVAPPTGGDATVGSPGGVGMDQADVVGAVADASIPTATTFGPPPTNQAERDARAAAMEAEGRRQRGVDTAATAGVPEFSDQGTPQGMPAMDPNAPVRNEAQYSNQFVPNPPPSMSQQPPGSISIDGGVDMLGNPLAPPDPNRMPVIGGGGEGERSVFSDEFGGPAYDPFGPGVPTVAEQAEERRQSGGPSPEEMGAVMQQQPTGQLPGFSDEFGGGPGLSTPTIQNPETDPAALMGPPVGFDPSAVSQQPPDYSGMPQSLNAGPEGNMQLQQPTGFSDEFGGGPMGMTATTPEERARIEQMAMNMPIVDEQRPPMTQQQQIEAAIGLDASDPSSPAVAQQQIPGGQPPADGEQFTPASIGGIETVLAQEGPTVTAASALGRPEGEGVSAYMDATGVGSQIESAEQDYQQQLNALQARQAGSGAFGSRGDLEEMGAMGEHLRNIGQIRAAGFDKAAQRMEQDLAREQQATMQEAQLGGQLTGQQLAASQALGQEERATAQALQNMGRDQRDIQQDQMAFDYEQWLRSQEGGGRELAMLQGMLPQAEIQKLAREQGLGSKVFGGLLAGGGLASKFFGGGAL